VVPATRPVSKDKKDKAAGVQPSKNKNPSLASSGQQPASDKDKAASSAADADQQSSNSKLVDLKRKIFDPLSKSDSAVDLKGDIKILLTAAPKNLVEKYIRIFKAAGLKLLSLETEAFALERSLGGNASQPVMIIDIGSVSSDVVIIDRGVPVLTRSIDTGGVTITQAVMKSLNVDLKRAEQFKRDIGFSSSGPGDLPEIIKTTINPIINEVKYCLDIYFTQQSEGETHSLEKIILTGGSAFLPDLVNYLNQLLEIKVIIGDPWDKVIYPLELKPVLQELAPRFSVAVGLAMREII
jgi:type IV pilus assembly protein PilM